MCLLFEREKAHTCCALQKLLLLIFKIVGVMNSGRIVRDLQHICFTISSFWATKELLIFIRLVLCAVCCLGLIFYLHSGQVSHKPTMTRYQSQGQKQ